MRRTVSLKLGQYLLLMVALLAIGAAGGVMTVAFVLHIRKAIQMAFPFEAVGMFAFLALSIWKTMEQRAPGKPLYF